MLCIYPTYSLAIDNASFENSDNSWQKTNNSVELLLNQNYYKEGSVSAQIINNSSSSYGIEQTITNIVPEKNYKFASFIHLQNPPPAKAFMRIAWYSSIDGTGSQIKTEDSEIVTTETDWKEITILTTAPINANSAKLRLLVSSGSAYFDSISITELQITPPVTIAPTVQPLNKHIKNIFISEVMVYPSTNEPEWVEIFNDNNEEITLVDWFIDDVEDGGAAPKKFSLTISPFSYTSIEVTSSLFNNTGDEVRLLNNNKEIVDSFSYEASEKNISLGKQNNLFCMQTPTKNKKNNMCLEPTQNPTPTQKILITNTPAVLATSFTKTKTITPTEKPTVIPKKLFTTNQSVQKINTTEPVVIIDKPVSPHNHSPKPWLIVSGSYSLLACISLVSKTFIFRYT